MVKQLVSVPRTGLCLVLALAPGIGCTTTREKRVTCVRALLPQVRLNRSGAVRPETGNGLHFKPSARPALPPPSLWVYQVSKNSLPRAEMLRICRQFGLRGEPLRPKRGFGPLDRDKLHAQKGDSRLTFIPSLGSWHYVWKGGRWGLQERVSASPYPKGKAGRSLGADGAKKAAIGFLQKRGLLPDSYFIEGVYVQTREILSGASGRAQEIAYEVVVKKRVGKYRSAGSFLHIGLVLDGVGTVVQLDYSLEELVRWRRFPTRTVRDAFAALNRGDGQAIPSAFQSGSARFVETIYFSESDRNQYVQPVYMFMVEKGKAKRPAYAPALADRCYRALPPLTEKWQPEGAGHAEMKRRLMERCAQIKEKERTAWRTSKQTRKEIAKVSKRLDECLVLWEEAAASVTPKTRSEFVSFAKAQVQTHLDEVKKSRLQRRGRPSRPIDVERVVHARTILEMLELVPGSGVDTERFLGRYSDIVRWVATTEWESE